MAYEKKKKENSKGEHILLYLATSHFKSRGPKYYVWLNEGERKSENKVGNKNKSLLIFLKYYFITLTASY